MDSFYTVVYKAYCDKCVDGFKEITEQGYRVWKEEMGFDDRAIDGGDLGQLLESIRTKHCDVLSAEKPDPKIYCDDLIEKFRVAQSVPDPRYTSSKATWERFIGALKEGNRTNVLDCFEATARAQYETYFASLTENDMKDMAERISILKFGNIKDNYQEVVIENGDKAGLALFVNRRGEWKISHL